MADAGKITKFRPLTPFESVSGAIVVHKIVSKVDAKESEAPEQSRDTIRQK